MNNGKNEPIDGDKRARESISHAALRKTCYGGATVQQILAGMHLAPSAGDVTDSGAVPKTRIDDYAFRL